MKAKIAQAVCLMKLCATVVIVGAACSLVAQVPTHPGRSHGALTATLSFLSLTFNETALACASCGSGSGSPLVLFPNESWKVYAGAGFASGFVTISPSGTATEDKSFSLQATATVAVGYAFNRRSFLTLTTPLVYNQASEPDERSHAGLGDPSVHLRYALVEGDFTDPWVPQVQAVAGHRFAVGTSIRDAAGTSDVVKVTGSGTNETELGVDIWSGFTLIKWGLGHSVLFPQGRTFAGNTHFEPGLGQQSVATIGISQDGLGKVIAGVTRLEREPIRVNGDEVTGSLTRDHGVFVTSEFWYAPLRTLRLTLTRTGLGSKALGTVNTGGRTTITLAWMAALADSGGG